jgi:hypothetical protein
MRLPQPIRDSRVAGRWLGLTGLGSADWARPARLPSATCAEAAAGDVYGGGGSGRDCPRRSAWWWVLARRPRPGPSLQTPANLPPEVTIPT